MNKSFYAKQDTKTPLFVGIAVIITNFLLCYALSSTSLGYAGLALATALNATINGLILTVILNKHYKAIINKDLIIYLIKIIISSAIMLLLVYATNEALIGILTGSLIKQLGRVLIGTAVGVVSYFIVTTLLKVNEFTKLLKSN